MAKFTNGSILVTWASKLSDRSSNIRGKIMSKHMTTIERDEFIIRSHPIFGLLEPYAMTTPDGGYMMFYREFDETYTTGWDIKMNIYGPSGNIVKEGEVLNENLLYE